MAFCPGNSTLSAPSFPFSKIRMALKVLPHTQARLEQILAADPWDQCFGNSEGKCSSSRCCGLAPFAALCLFTFTSLPPCSDPQEKSQNTNLSKLSTAIEEYTQRSVYTFYKWVQNKKVMGAFIFGAKAGLCSKLRSLSPDQLLVGLQHNLEPCGCVEISGQSVLRHPSRASAQLWDYFSTGWLARQMPGGLPWSYAHRHRLPLLLCPRQDEFHYCAFYIFLLVFWSFGWVSFALDGKDK